jgi:hypothetical protein
MRPGTLSSPTLSTLATISSVTPGTSLQYAYMSSRTRYPMQVTVPDPATDFIVSGRGGITFDPGGGWAYFNSEGVR